jgi:hypothetical protein
MSLTSGSNFSDLFESTFLQEVNSILRKKRSNSSEDLMRKGLNYKFSLKDLNKYSKFLWLIFIGKNLNQRDLENRFSKTAMGKRVPTLADRIRMLEANQRKLKEELYWDSLKNLALLQ